MYLLGFLAVVVAYFVGEFSIVACLAIFLLVIKVKPLFSSTKDPWTDTTENIIKRAVFFNFREYTRSWHSYELHGFDYSNGPNILLLGYHSRCTIDIFYLITMLQPAVMVTHLLFYIPILGTLMSFLGAISNRSGINDGRSEKAFIEALIHGNRPLVLLPGGAWEFSKPSNENFKVLWRDEPGYARVFAASPELAKIKIIPFFTRNCENIFYTDAKWHDWSGKKIRSLMQSVKEGNLLLVPPLLTILFFSVGMSLSPLPTKLDTYFAEPLTVKAGESALELNARVVRSLEDLIVKANHAPPRQHFTEATLAARIEKFTTFVLNGLVMLLQNILQAIVMIFLIWIVLPLPLLAAIIGRKVKGSRKQKLV